MKRLIYLIAGVILLGVLGYIAYDLSSSAGTSDPKIAALDFDIKDTAAINKIIITEPNGAEIELVRSGKTWSDKDGGCIEQVQVHNILEAAYNIRFKGYIPDNAMKIVTNRMATVGTKVQYFIDGEWVKTWYIGTSTPDHYGTYMLVESVEHGKSDLPVITEIKGMKGIISPRFFADQRRWMCTNVFAYDLKQIKKVTVRFTETPQRNFEVQQQNNRFRVTTNGKPFPAVDTSMVYRYLLNYKKIHFESPNYELTEKQLDSVKRAKPFCVLTVNAAGETKQLKLFRKKSMHEGRIDINDFGEEADYDINHFWCLLPNGQIVQCQYFVFNPLIMGHIYFNYGASNPGPV
jgi:hypothetical protein